MTEVIPWLAPVVGAVAAVLWARWAFPSPHRAVVSVIGVICVLPAAAFPSIKGLPQLTLLDVGLAVATASWVWSALRGRTRWNPTAGGVAVVAFLGLLMVAFVQGLGSTVPEQQLAFGRLVLGVLFFFSVSHGLQTRRALQEAVVMTVAGSWLAACLAIALYLLPSEANHRFLEGLGWVGYPVGDSVVRFVADTGVRRATGAAIDPNLLGGLLALSLPLALSQGFGLRPGLQRILFLMSAGTIAIALLLTFSRAAWIGAFVSMIVLGFVGYRRIWWGIPVAVVAAAAGPWRENIWQRLQSGVLWSDRASLMRIEEYREAMARVAQNPVLGIGFGTPPGMDPLLRVSSTYLLVAEQSGLVGLIAFLAAPSLILWASAQQIRRGQPKDTAAIRAGAAAALCGALAIGLFDHYFFNYGFPQTIALFWLIAGLAAWPLRLRPDG
ncbi:MAG: O-antigen ligase domain-containing protein [Dehalococcoidia bacterium]|nr:O-antigen ligase domain-containing protein [Dehalococcoidia bacterium]